MPDNKYENCLIIMFMIIAMMAMIFALQDTSGISSRQQIYVHNLHKIVESYDDRIAQLEAEFAKLSTDVAMKHTINGEINHNIIASLGALINTAAELAENSKQKVRAPHRNDYGTRLETS